MIAHDNLRLGFSFVFLLVSALTILISTVWVERENVPVGEYHALLMFATFGMMLMASGNDLVIIFLGLETLSIATYVMAGLRRGDLKSNESAMKYFILGSFASAFLLYGMALDLRRDRLDEHHRDRRKSRRIRTSLPCCLSAAR